MKKHRVVRIIKQEYYDLDEILNDIYLSSAKVPKNVSDNLTYIKRRIEERLRTFHKDATLEDLFSLSRSKSIYWARVLLKVRLMNLIKKNLKIILED